MEDYRAFLAAKVAAAPRLGFDVGAELINPALKPFTGTIVRWALAGGRRAIFASFGLHKTATQLEIMRQVMRRDPAAATLIVHPLGVRQEFTREATERFPGLPVRFIRSPGEVEPGAVHLTNYETVRDGRLDPALFAAASLDEASVLRGFGGTKTFREFMRLFAAVPLRFVATATPSPNQYIELLSYAAFLDVMDVGQAKTRWFRRNSEKADELTIHPHKEREFWLWVASWALFVQRPSDLGCSDDGYALPPLDVRWHEVADAAGAAEPERDGQGKLFADAAIGVSSAARVKRDSLPARVAKMMELRAEAPEAHRLLWHDLESERAAIERAIPGVTAIWGAQDLDERERRVVAFSDGEVAELAAKPVIAGSGCNFQRHCAWAVFLGIGFKFNDFIQAIHRVQRFGQSRPVRVDLIYAAAERGVRRALEAKWRRHEELLAIMSEIIRENGLTQAALGDLLERSMGVARVEASGPAGAAEPLYRCIHNDCVEELRTMASDSVDLVVTSIPFSTQYEYSPSFNDFGHTDDDAHFWRQMDFLIPELLRVTKPGRNACIHVKDRITPGGINGLGFQTLSPFSDDCVTRFRQHGWAFLARKSVITDVVRENAQTYRLGFSEQCKDGTRQGAGVPEYLLIFRKAQTDRTKGYADHPVVKLKKVWDRQAGAAAGALALLSPGEQAAAAEEFAAAEAAYGDLRYGCVDADPALVGAASERLDRARNRLGLAPAAVGAWRNPHGYSRGRWQFDAHGFQRSSGDRMITLADLVGAKPDEVFKAFRRHSLADVYDFEFDVHLAEGLDARGQLPPDFMLLQPQSWHPDVWTDVARMRTLNGLQAAKGHEMHLCPLQFDIVDRAILQRSEPGDVVLDPFGGLMTVPYRAVQLGRRGIGIELSAAYWRDGCTYCEAAARGRAMPSLFDLLEAGAEAGPANPAAADPSAATLAGADA